MRSEAQLQALRSVQARLDSLVRAEAALQLQRWSLDTCETVTDVVVYDTSKPAVDCSGRPPVKATLHTERRQRRQSGEAAQAAARTETQVTETRCEADTLELAGVTTSERRPEAGTGVLRFGLGTLLVAGSILAVGIFYKRLKR